VDPTSEDLMLVRAHERKLLEAVGVLEQARYRMLAVAADAVDSSHAVVHQAAQARRHSKELLGDAAHMAAVAERLIGEARAIHGEYTRVSGEA
jgi:hypothetical protein